jgi:hypothetical protein
MPSTTIDPNGVLYAVWNDRPDGVGGPTSNATRIFLSFSRGLLSASPPEGVRTRPTGAGPGRPRLPARPAPATTARMADLAGIGVLSAAASGVLARGRPWRKPLAGYQFGETIVATPPGASSERYLTVMVAVKISSSRDATAARRSVHTGWTEPSMAAMPS